MKTANCAANTEDFEFSALEEAHFYPRAIAKEFAPYLKGQIIEVGAGIGQMTSLFAKQMGKENITAVEPDAKFAAVFQKNCPEVKLVNGTVTDLPPDTACNAIVSVNVLEHIEDHVEELGRYQKMLARKHGHVCILTPAGPELYAAIDKDFGHFRRYTKSAIKEALGAAGFKTKAVFYFNFPGYFVWLLNFKIMRSRGFNPNMVKLYDRLVFRATHALETRVMRPPIGQSVIAIAEA